MRKQGRKISALGATCLTFLFILSSLFGCALSSLKKEESKFNQASWYCHDGRTLNIFLPLEWPDIEKGAKNGTFKGAPSFIEANICVAQNVEIKTGNLYCLFNDCCTCELYAILRIIGQEYTSWIIINEKPVLSNQKEFNKHLSSKTVWKDKKIPTIAFNENKI